jgi:hypothetical protein
MRRQGNEIWLNMPNVDCAVNSSYSCSDYYAASEPLRVRILCVSSLEGGISRLFWSLGKCTTGGCRRDDEENDGRGRTACDIRADGFGHRQRRADRGWRASSLWVPAMILLSPVRPHYLVLLMVPFAMIAEAARCGEAEPPVIYATLPAISWHLPATRWPC